MRAGWDVRARTLGQRYELFVEPRPATVTFRLEWRMVDGEWRMVATEQHDGDGPVFISAAEFRAVLKAALNAVRPEPDAANRADGQPVRAG